MGGTWHSDQRQFVKVVLYNPIQPCQVANVEWLSCSADNTQNEFYGVIMLYGKAHVILINTSVAWTRWEIAMHMLRDWVKSPEVYGILQ